MYSESTYLLLTKSQEVAHALTYSTSTDPAKFRSTNSQHACIQELDELISTAEIEEMFKKADSDGSGSVCFDEFLNIMERRASMVDPNTFNLPTSPVAHQSTIHLSGTSHGGSAPSFNMLVWNNEKPAVVQVSEIEVMDPNDV